MGIICYIIINHMRLAGKIRFMYLFCRVFQCQYSFKGAKRMRILIPQEEAIGIYPDSEIVCFVDSSSDKKFTFFWKKESPFSQHHMCNFAIEGVRYNCAEQYMMHQKACEKLTHS